MAAIREERRTLGGFETRALVLPRQPGSAEAPLVLFHGFSDSADTWRPLMRLLAASGRGAVAFDLPGFGRADHLDRNRPVLPQLDAFAVAAIEDAARTGPTGSVVVVGNSLGGVVALRAAQRDDLSLAGIVPIAPAGLDMAAWINIIEGAWTVQAVLRSPMPVPEVVVRGLMGRTYRRFASARPADLDEEVVTAFTRSFASKRDVVRLLGMGRRLRHELRDPFQLEWIDCPVLVIWGDSDLLVHPSGGERLVAEVAGARLEVIESCGHCPQVECPEVVLGLIEAFPPGSAARAVRTLARSSR